MQTNQKWTTKLKSLAAFLKLVSSSELQSTRCNVNDNFINSAEDSTKVFRYCQSSREVNSLQTRGAFRHLDFKSLLGHQPWKDVLVVNPILAQLHWLPPPFIPFFDFSPTKPVALKYSWSLCSQDQTLYKIISSSHLFQNYLFVMTPCRDSNPYQNARYVLGFQWMLHVERSKRGSLYVSPLWLWHSPVNKLLLDKEW